MPVAQSLKSCAALWNTNSSRSCQVKISTSSQLTLSPLSDYVPCTKFILREVGCSISLLIVFRRDSSRSCQVKISTSSELTLSPLSDYVPCPKFILREVGCRISLLIVFRRDSSGNCPVKVSTSYKLTLWFKQVNPFTPE